MLLWLLKSFLEILTQSTKWSQGKDKSSYLLKSASISASRCVGVTPKEKSEVIKSSLISSLGLWMNSLSLLEIWCIKLWSASQILKLIQGTYVTFRHLGHVFKFFLSLFSISDSLILYENDKILAANNISFLVLWSYVPISYRSEIYVIYVIYF